MVLKNVSARAVNDTGRAGLIIGMLLSIFCIAAHADSSVPTHFAVDPSGQYTFTGTLPAPMHDFGAINLIAANRHPDRITGELVCLKRSASGASRYKLIPASIIAGQLIFKTRIINGISYGFEGRISARRLPESEGGYDVPLLEGTVRKFRRGRQLAEITWSFKYEEFAD